MTATRKSTTGQQTTAAPGEPAQSWWLEMGPEVFDTSLKPTQGAMFPEPDPLGSPELFDLSELP